MVYILFQLATKAMKARGEKEDYCKPLRNKVSKSY